MPVLLSPSTVLARSERLSWRVLDGEALILHPSAGTLHRLNETGTRLWELLDGNRSVEGIALALTNEYEITQEDAVEQLLELADGLVGNDLVEVRT